MDPNALVHPDDADTAFDAFVNLFDGPAETGRVGAPVILRLRHKDDTWHWTAIVGHDLRDVPSVGGLVLAFRDVNERTEARRAIEKSERRFRALVQHGSDVVFTFDDDLTVTSISESLREILGYLPDRTVGGGAFAMV